MMHDPPRPCPACWGKNAQGCTECGGWGLEVLLQCPLMIIEADHWEAIAAAELAEKGSWPVAGGWLDQTKSCVDATRMVWEHAAWWKAKRGG